MSIPLASGGLPGLLISGGIVLAAAAVFATTGQETRSEAPERHPKSRHGRNTRSVIWSKGQRNDSRATPTGEGGAAVHAGPRSLPLEVLAARAAAARRAMALENRAGGWASPAEARIAETAVLLPGEIHVTLEDVIGLEDTVKDMRRRIVLPLLRHDSSHFADALPTSVLLHGPSGCGKRTLALAVAREAHAVFIDARAALDRWHGPAAECMALVMLVAHALQPAVVYVDGADSLLGVLRPALNPAGADAAPSQSAALGRGYTGAFGTNVVIIGATRDVSNLDADAVGHFRLQYNIAAPGAAAREALLARILFQECRRFKLDGLNMDLWKSEGATAVPGSVTLRQCAIRTQGFSGSALRALVRRTVELAVDEALVSNLKKGEITAAHLGQALTAFVPLYSR